MPDTMQLVVTGAGGRMGQALIKVLSQTPGVRLIGAIAREGSPHLGRDAGELAGLGTLDVEVTDDPLPVFARADGIIDFTAPATSLVYAGLAAQARIVDVIGTTGFTADEERQLLAAARHARVVQSGNMSLGVNLLSLLVHRAARTLQADWDIEIVEMHHRHKVDAPSGTALMLGEAAAAGRQIDLASNSVRERDGFTGARPCEAIGFATLRGGSVIGEHSVIFAGEGERIELTHRSQDRMIFARGAVKAALWAMSQKPGLYSMLDVLGLDEPSP